MSFRIALEPHELFPDRAFADFLNEGGDDGAVISFTGLTRPASKNGDALISLYLDHYPGMTERTLTEIADDAAQRFPVSRLCIIHRCGPVAPHAPIVFVAAAAPHRRAAFFAADYVMDRLKTDAGFWKREDLITGSHWIEPTDQDHIDHARWSHFDAGN